MFGSVNWLRNRLQSKEKIIFLLFFGGKKKETRDTKQYRYLDFTNVNIS
jgi:hypothetical protein